MKFPNIVKSFSVFEIVLSIIFVLYLFVPFHVPMSVAAAANSPYSIMFFFLVTILLFLFTNPIVALLYMFFAYELVRRSFIQLQQSLNLRSVPHVPVPAVIQQKFENNRTKKIKPTIRDGIPAVHSEINADQESSFSQGHSGLETDLVDKLAPIGKSETSVPVESSFGPMYQSVGTASVF
jgi:hypothetical protein